MALLNLIASGLENVTLNIPANLSTEYFTHEFSNNILTMERVCDVNCPEYLEIELNPNIDRNNFKNICHKVCFEMEIGGSRILYIPLRFMMHLKDYEICDNKFYISIPFQMFCDNIKLINLQFQDVKFKLTNTENNFALCKLISKGIYYDLQNRREIAHGNHDNIVQQLASTEITYSNERNEFMYRIPFTSIHKGFFIESENVDEINEIKLKLNQHIRTNYNRFLVRTKCVKINQHLLYFPLNYDKSYTDRTIEGFEGSLNLSRIDSSKLYIKLDNPQSKICIYGLGSNMLKYTNNMCGLSHYSYTDHNYEEYNEESNEESNEDVNYTYRLAAYRSRPILPPIQTQLAPIQTQSASVIINQSNAIVYKPITNNDKLTCSITQEDILVNARYMSCSQCSNNFDESSIKTWFRQRHHKNCPMCRSNWCDFNVYINGVEPEPVDFEETNIPEILDPSTST
jgi:hypothetical protein